jgi:hypothetical protein
MADMSPGVATSVVSSRSSSSSSENRGVVSSRPRPPKLNDASRYVKVDRVPIIDTLERTYFKNDPKTGKQIKIYESIDKTQLKTILDNSRQRAAKGNYGLATIGHTDDDGNEISQPPKVGYMANYQLGEHDGRPTILADIYIDKRKCENLKLDHFNNPLTPDDILDEFPRRSAEIIAISKPNGYIDSVALLKRTPERDLGLVTSQYNRKSEQVYRFDCPACKGNKSKSMAHQMAEHEARQGKVKSKRDVAKNAIALVTTLLNHILDEEAAGGIDDEDNGIEDDSSMATSTKAKFAKADPSEPSEEEIPKKKGSSSSSEPSEASGDPSKPEAKNKRKEKSEPSRMDPEPSRMSKKKSKMQAGGAGDPGAMTNMPTSSSSGEPSVAVKTKTKMSSSDEKTRMKEDEDRISISRFQRELDRRDKIIEGLTSRFEELDSDKKSAINERKLMQLQAEGYDLDRSEELARFKKLNLTDEQVDEEISRFRKISRPSPVGQGMIPSFSPDLGGASVPRQKSVHELLRPLPEENDPRNRDMQTREPINAPIIGSHFARQAVEAKVRYVVKNNHGGNSVDIDEISRFIKDKSSQ